MIGTVLADFIQAPVGRALGDANRPADVLTIQYLANIARLSRIPPLPENGLCDAALLAWIDTFQHGLRGICRPDGRIDPNSRSLIELVARARERWSFRPAPNPAPGMTALWRSMREPPHRSHVNRNLDLAGIEIALRRAAILRVTAGSGNAGQRLTSRDYELAAALLGPKVQAALVEAMAAAESAGSGFGPDGRPVIAFEGHYFRRRTGGSHDRLYPLLSYRYQRKAGPEWRTNNATHLRSWQTLELALELDHEAALLSCSWGMFQIMGRNYAACGYKTIDAFVAAMRAGVRTQLEAFVGFCRSKKLGKAFEDEDYVALAKGYNGRDYGDYDKRIERFHDRFRAKASGAKNGGMKAGF